ncbi:MAG: glycosyltransferase [Thermoplasmatales archaeon]
MKTAVVVPWIPAIKGSALAIAVAKYLKREGAEVDFIAHTVASEHIEELKEMLGCGVNLIILEKSNKEKINTLSYLKYQYFSRMDKDISKFISNSSYDFVLVISDEGHAIAKTFKKSINEPLSNIPKFGILMQELIDYSFESEIYTSYGLIRKFARILLPIFHNIEKKRLNYFDFVYSNSEWTSKNLMLYYGIKARMAISPVDEELFGFNSDVSTKSCRIALPTAALDKSGKKLVKRLKMDGIDLVAYGSKQVEGVPNLGFLSREEMSSVIASASALLFYFDYEALGLIPIESLMLGTPVITIPKQGPLSSLSYNKFVKFANNYQEFLDSCKYFLQQSSDRDIRSECAYSVRNFSAAIVVHKLYEDIKEMIK